jgi:formate-dependent nitrite reductase membrane component NrfD
MSATSTSPEGALSYYGKPIIKEPVWKPEIPAYFFVGGLAGAAGTLSGAARLAGNEVLARRLLYVSAAGVTISPYLLIKDLGRPEKFLNMLRVFKVTSPMSVGTWILSADGTATGIAAACELLDVLPRVRIAAETVSAALGPALSSYTGALVADSVVPVWHEARHELPLLFAASSAAAAGGAGAMLVPPAAAAPARRLAIAGGLTVFAVKTAMERRLGKFLAEPFHKGPADRYTKLSDATTLGGVALMALGGRTRPGAVAAGALLLVGSWCKRFSVFHAGKISAADPTYTSLTQKRRVAERGHQPATSPKK